MMTIGIGPASAVTPALTPTWSVIPTTVKDGDYVAFRAEIRNDDTSTVSQLFLVETARDPNLTLVPGAVTASQGTCSTTGATFNCSLGQLKPHKTAKVTAVFTTADITPDYSATESWEFNTVGLGSGGGDNSHGDKWQSVDSAGNPLLVAHVTSDPDFGGRYVLNTTLLVVENSQAINNTNRHSTRAYSPGAGIGVTVEDVDCSTNPDPICALFTTGTSAVSKVNVNDGIDVSGTPGTTLLHFYLQADSSELLAGQNANNLVVTHVYLDEVTHANVTETISIRCIFAKKSPATPTNAPCITVKNLGGGDLGVDVWTFHNGGMKL